MNILNYFFLLVTLEILLGTTTFIVIMEQNCWDTKTVIINLICPLKLSKATMSSSIFGILNNTVDCYNNLVKPIERTGLDKLYHKSKYIKISLVLLNSLLLISCK